MYYPAINLDGNARNVIELFGGYNHNRRIASGEFYDMKNLSSDEYPLMSPRQTRALLVKSDNIRGILYSDNKLIYLDGDILVMPDERIDLSDFFKVKGQKSEQQLIRFGAYVLVWPEQIYVNTITKKMGTWGSKYTVPKGITTTFSICDADGKAFENMTVSEEAPEDPKDGQYWLCNKEGHKGLNIWYEAKGMWQPVATCYIRITVPEANLTEHFEEGDTVYMNAPIEDINEGSRIVAIGDDYITVIAFMDDVEKTRTSNDSWSFYIERKIPDMDYICTDKNRVWGCKYGFNGTELVNEIYASKLGDFANWYQYSGISTDSYAVNVGVPGAFTGCISYQGMPVFFKEDQIFRVYGNMPADYQLLQTEGRGVQKGSYKSLAKVGEFLFYKSTSDVCIYDGSYPQPMSSQFGREELYYDGVAGACLDKYYLACETSSGQKRQFVYDTQNGMWMKEDAPGFKQISAAESGQIYACTDTEIWGLGSRDNVAFLTELVGEEYVEWEAVTGELGLETPDSKYVDKIIIRAYIPHASEIQIAISINDRPFDEVGVMRSRGDEASQAFAFNPCRCDHFRLRLKGHGSVRVYSIVIQMEAGGEDDGYSYR